METDLLKEFVANMGVAIAVTTGVVQVIKEVGLPSRLAPLFALFVGVGSVFIFTGGVFNFATVGMGIIAGLSASGLYNGVKKTAGTDVKATVALGDVKMTAPSDTDVKLES